MTTSREIHPELPIRINLPGYDALVQGISKLSPESKETPPPLFTTSERQDTQCDKDSGKEEPQ